MADNIWKLYTEGINTDDATASSNDIVTGKTAYVKGEKITGTLVINTSKISTGTVTAKSGNITISCGFKPTHLALFMWREYSISNTYQYSTSGFFISAYWDGTKFSVCGGFDTTNNTMYINGSNKNNTISVTSTGATVNIVQYVPYTNGTPIRWIAWK